MAKRHASRGPGWSPNFVSDRDALARLMEAEAGGEGDAGKLAVANVVRNRADSNYSGYGKDITSQVRARSQFSAFNPHGSVNATGKRTMAMPADGETMRHNYELADRVLARMEPDPTHGANQYYAPQGMPGHRAPRWWNDQYKTAEIGHQKFQSNPASRVTPDAGHAAMGDQQQLALRGGDKGGGLADVMTAALKQAQPTQSAKTDNLPGWAKAQAEQVAQARSGQYAPPPPGSALNRINPKDPSGPLLPEPGAAPQRQMADVKPNDFGRGIPASRMETPGVGQRLDPTPPTQMAQISPNDFGRGIPASRMETPGLNPALAPTPPTQMAQSAPPPGSVLNRINPADPSGPLLPEAGAPPTQMAQISPNDFGRGIPANGMQTPGVGMALEQMLPAQMAQVGMNDFGGGIANSPMQTPGVGMALDPQTPPPPVQMADAGDSSLKQQLDAQWENRTPYTPHMQETPQALPSALTPSTTNAPLPPIRPEIIAPPIPVEGAPRPSPMPQQMTHHSQPQPMLHEPMAGPSGGGMEGFASGMGGQQGMSPVAAMNDPFAGGGLGDLFGNAFAPDQGFQTADAGFDPFAGMDFGGGGGGFDLGSLFG